MKFINEGHFGLYCILAYSSLSAFNFFKYCSMNKMMSLGSSLITLTIMSLKMGSIFSFIYYIYLREAGI